MEPTLIMGREQAALKQTGFQKYSENSTKVIDFTEVRLLYLIKTATEQRKRIQYAALLADYKAGKIVVAWKSGQPVFALIRKG